MVLDLGACEANDELIVKSKVKIESRPLRSYGEHLFYGLNANHDRLAIIDHPSKRQWTAGQVVDEATKIARGLVREGLGDGHMIMGYMPNNDLHVVCQVGIYAAASVFVGCYWTNPHRELKHHVEDSDSEAIFCGAGNVEIAAQVADEVETVKLVVVIDDAFDAKLTLRSKRIISLETLVADASVNIEIPRKLKSPDDPCCILFSSGSTGRPKPVIRTHRNCVIYNLRTQLPAGVNIGTTTCHQPLPHLSGHYTVTMACYNFAIVTCEGFDCESFCEMTQEHKIGMVFLAPSAIAQLLKFDRVREYDLSSVEFVFTGGAPFPNSLKKPCADLFKIKCVKQSYAATEAGSVSTSMFVDDPDTCGVPTPGVEIKVVDRATGNALGPNQVGECYVRGEHVSPGYYKMPDATRENYTDDGFLKTGDALYYNEKGLLYIVDRYKEVIYVDTKQVPPSELESVLLSHANVAEAAVVGVPDDDHGQVPRAYVVLKNPVEERAFKAELIEYVKKEVAEWKQLRGGIVIVDDLPKISFGKIDRKSLKVMTGVKNF